ncbi:MAG TPA: TrmH family RNA methyltransferase [Candidatus Paceibacterota bacterium]|jgi:tRNA G18 (ribose-2'-O)-methylase SpoU|nr:RNA methyltransferase [Parcubacteria group bacterium]MDP6119548.1 TrmH family RNA methyltransferase [Candidatus Paceibacterota bacterium]HJN63006.1 TrmH family RNA methyltransferase [Candidatus Paceibacterota bacterium]|tara:strand:- start:3974 stop:4432 length:459 start_codon:yes stop_codon:yes gene_type:complete
METFIILHNIRSAYNVGSVFRTADGAGVSKVYLTGYTPTPKDRFGRYRKDISKVALGAEKIIPWEYSKNIDIVLNKLKKEKVRVVAVEQDKKSKDYKKLKIKSKTTFIFGNEVNGLSKSVLKKTDSIVEVKMKGEKESLNVSVVVGIILFNS